MKSRILFWTLAILVFGSLFVSGFLVRADIYKFFIFESIAVLAVILFIILYIRLIRPYHIISSAMELLKEQDFSSRLRPISNTEANKLITTFNKMMDQLREERLQVREKNRFLDLLINASPMGVIILDFDENISEINPSAIRLLNTDNTKIIGKKLSNLDNFLGKSLANLKAGEDFILRGSGLSMYRCVRSSFIDRGFAHPFILIEELTKELLKTEKESYENVIRMLAHEVNNSVGAISSTLNVISDSLNQNADNELIDVLPAVDASFDRCHHLSGFISNFSEVVKIPKPSLSEVDINDVVRSVEAFTTLECQKRNINLLLDLSKEECHVSIDRIQFEQVLVNIIKNALEAIGNNGKIRIKTTSSPLSISIEDNGPGLSEEVAQKLFTPFFTTKPSGQGIGLMFVREVLSNHQCKFDFKTVGDWTKFHIFFEE
ncbi:ATP-binding protein [Bacteroidales bacterium OttesenSCG-928-C19]|nr:ATP-binding protein [Bacteroidales bacterium OttesenSCG-928-C19]